MHLSLICAIAENNAIGNKGALLFYLPADLKHFKNITTGHTIIMGRKTFDSLPKGALPNRRNIVLSRQENFSAANVEVFHDLNEALNACTTDEEVYIIGGESIYKAALPQADTLHLTYIHETPAEADTYFPAFNPEEWETVQKEEHLPDEKNRYKYTFVEYRRK